MERRNNARTFIGRIGETLRRNAIYIGWQSERGAIIIQFPEVMVERPVLLEHEDDVIDALDPQRSAATAAGCPGRSAGSSTGGAGGSTGGRTRSGTRRRAGGVGGIGGAARA